VEFAVADDEAWLSVFDVVPQVEEAAGEEWCGRYGCPSPRPRSSTSLTIDNNAEADRRPDLAAGLFDVVFGTITGNLAAHLVATTGLPADEADAVANELIGLAAHPALPRLLFGVDPLTEETPDQARLATAVDLARIRRLVRLFLPATT
jgi:hypothetical protein